MKKYLSLIIIFIMANSSGFSQSVETVFEEDEIVRISSLKGVDQHGDEFNFPEVDKKSLLIFFLPKTQSRSEAEGFLDEIRIYMKRIDNEFDNHAERLLIIEPYRSGRLINRLFRSKMREENFTVIRDSDSKIIREVNRDQDEILLLLTNREGFILYKTNQPFNDNDFTRVKLELMPIIPQEQER